MAEVMKRTTVTQQHPRGGYFAKTDLDPGGDREQPWHYECRQA